MIIPIISILLSNNRVVAEFTGPEILEAELVVSDDLLFAVDEEDIILGTG